MTTRKQLPETRPPQRLERGFGLVFAWIAVFLVLAIWLSGPANAARIKDVTNMQGVRPNQLVGYGLVVGLDGSGDQTTQTPFTVQSMISMLSQLGVTLPGNTNLQLKNVAAVSVTATLQPYARPGQTMDVTVSSLGNAKSLKGGTLLLTPLKGIDGQIYAIAQGNVLVGGAGASGGGSSAQVNHLNAGRIPSGATVERAVPTPVGQGGMLLLETLDTDFTTVYRVVEAINKVFGADTAQALDGRMIRVRAPIEPNARIAFLAQLENLPVNPGEQSPRVILNARTGSVVMNQLVTVAACAVAHGNLTVTVGAENQVSQPNPAAAGQTTTVQNADVSIKTDRGGLVVVPSATNLAEVVKALNAVGATPQDLLAILQAMKSAGALRADLEII